VLPKLFWKVQPNQVMKNKNLRMKEKLYELSKKTVIYVLGGNHRLEAYKAAEGAEGEGD